MNQEHRISSVLDIIKLDEAQFSRFLPDLVVWYFASKKAEELGGVVKGFVWVDDGKPGEIHSIDALVGTENMTIKGSAWSER